MLCPEVWNFPEPKVKTSTEVNINTEFAKKSIEINNFYESLVLACPDEIKPPDLVEELLGGDSDYYKMHDCPLNVFINMTFIDNFIKRGTLYCLSTDADCVVHNCFVITPDGILTIHVPDYTFQCLGLEGKKRPLNFYEVQIPLKSVKNYKKLYQVLSKLDNFNFHITWTPPSAEICPSSIAKYFHDQKVKVSLEKLYIKRIAPEINEIPSLTDTDLDELTEWIGLLAIEADLSPSYDYVSSYKQPDSENAIRSTRMSILVLKGMLTPQLVNNICNILNDHVKDRDLPNYWASVSAQTCRNAPWRSNKGCKSIFQAHFCSKTLYFSKDGISLYSISEIKF